MAERKKKRPLDERIAIHREWAKTARWTVVTAGTVAAIGVIVWGMVMLDDDPVVAALKILFPTVTSAGIPVYVNYLSQRRTRRFTSDVVARVSRLEGRMDPARSSSTLCEDGTDPPGGLT